jgi:hypothetical protein
MSDPRPAEGPDRTAGGDLCAHWAEYETCGPECKPAPGDQPCAECGVEENRHGTVDGCSGFRPLPAPGDGEGLRAEREQFIRSAATNVGQDIMAADVRFLFDQLDHARAALAARDTDQGAGAAVPLCPVCREPVELWADLHGEAQADCTACDWQTEVAL